MVEISDRRTNNLRQIYDKDGLVGCLKEANDFLERSLCDDIHEVKMLKKPRLKDNELTQYCPICSKESAKEYLTYDKKEDRYEVEKMDANWWYIDPETCKFESAFYHSDIVRDEDIIYLKTKFDIKDNIARFYKEYSDRYGDKIQDGLSPYFCSKECAKKFIITRLK